MTDHQAESAAQSPRAHELVRRLTTDLQTHSNRRQKRQRRALARAAKAALAIVVATSIIIPTMIATGLLLGPEGHEGLFLAPLILLTTWAAILYWTFRGNARRVRGPKLSNNASVRGLAELPAQIDEWLDEQRRFLPPATYERLDSIGARLEVLGVQLASVRTESPETADVRELLSEELPELVRSYRKVPRAFQQKALHGGESPERQLIDGLATIDEQIGRLQEQIAAGDLRKLATHQRYLELKYTNEGKLE